MYTASHEHTHSQMVCPVHTVDHIKMKLYGARNGDTITMKASQILDFWAHPKFACSAGASSVGASYANYDICILKMAVNTEYVHIPILSLQDKAGETQNRTAMMIMKGSPHRTVVVPGIRACDWMDTVIVICIQR